MFSLITFHLIKQARLHGGGGIDTIDIGINTHPPNAQRLQHIGIVILTFNRLESIGANYIDTNSGMFSSKNLIYFRLKKEIHKHL